MKIKLIKIGNSMGIRLPQAIIKECGVEKEMELTLKQGVIQLTPIVKHRQGWKELMQDIVNQKSVKPEGEWEW